MFLLSVFFICLIGLSFGSFIHTTAYRRMENVSLSGRSHCDSCKKTIPIVYLIPLIGYALCKGKCKYCQDKIWIGYPIFEIVNASLLVILFFQSGFSFTFIHLAGFIEIGMYIAFVDSFSQTIDSFAVLLALVWQIIWLYILKLPLLSYVTGLLIGTTSFYWLRYLYEAFRSQEGLGEGDVALFGIIGFLGGINILLPTAFFAAFFGFLFSSIWLFLTKQGLQKTLPFAPWLILGFFITLIYPVQDIFFPNLLFLFKSFLLSS